MKRNQEYVYWRFFISFIMVLFLALWGTCAIAKQATLSQLLQVFLGLTAVMSVYVSISFGVAMVSRNQIITMLTVLCILYVSAYLPELNPREFCHSYLMLRMNGIADDGSGTKLFCLSVFLQIVVVVCLWLSPRNRKERSLNNKKSL